MEVPKVNIYIYSLEKGYENQSSGIKYSDLKVDLIDKFHVDFSFQFETHFRYWFFDNFYDNEAEKTLIHHKETSHARAVKELPFNENINSLCFIKGDSIMKYIDYLELSHARKSSTKATRIAYTSIIIASLSIIIPTITSKYFPPTILIEDSNKRDSTTKCEFKDSTCCEFGQHEMNHSKREIRNKLNNDYPKNDSIIKVKSNVKKLNTM